MKVSCRRRCEPGSGRCIGEVLLGLVSSAGWRDGGIIGCSASCADPRSTGQEPQMRGPHDGNVICGDVRYLWTPAMIRIVGVRLCPKYADCHSTAAKRRDDKSEICKKTPPTVKKSGLKFLGFRIVSSKIKHNTSPHQQIPLFTSRALVSCAISTVNPLLDFPGVLGGRDSLAQYACVGQSLYH
jgi:hypothetical protein